MRWLRSVKDNWDGGINAIKIELRKPMALDSYKATRDD